MPGPRPYLTEPLFTRDPAKIYDSQVLMAMMAIKGIYTPYHVRRLNHGIGYATAAIELILPTYRAELGVKGRIATNPSRLRSSRWTARGRHRDWKSHVMQCLFRTSGGGFLARQTDAISSTTCRVFGRWSAILTVLPRWRSP